MRRWHRRFGPATSKVQCALCLRKVGFGLTRSMRILVVGKATMHRFYRANGIATNPLRNGVALKGRGYRFQQFARRKAQAGRVVKWMEVRVAGCLAKKPKVIYHTTGMNAQQRAHWRYHNDPRYKVYQLCKRRMTKVLHGVTKTGACMELVGCTTSHLRSHIEAQFRDGMNWSNSGTGAGLWHIDHNIPCAVFDLTRGDQQRICFHWTNLRPLWSLDNIRKGKRMEAHMTPCFAM